MRFLFILILLLKFGFVFSQTDEDNVNRNLYKARRVKSMKIYESKLNGDGPGKREKLVDDKRFDTAGLITESFFYSKLVGGEFHQQYKYDSLGNLAELINFYKDEPLSKHYVYEYDKKNHIIQKTQDHENWYFTYDTDNNMITQKWVFYDTYSSTFFLDSFQYNSNRQLIKMTRYNNGQTIYFYKTYEYDNAGNKIKEVRFQNGEVTDTWIYHYDWNGYLLGEDYFAGNEVEKKESYFNKQYDENGLVKSEIVSNHFRRYVYEYY
jgi:hypothetical protein